MEDFRGKIANRSVLKLFDELGGKYQLKESMNPSTNTMLEFRPATHVDPPINTSTEKKFIYIGQWIPATGIMEGKGTILFQNGEVFEGWFLNGKANGMGRKIFQDGQWYTGQFKDNFKDGLGTLSKNNGEKYEGNWKAGLKEGFGRMQWFDGTIYEGEWRLDLKHGTGVQSWSNGDVYEGQYAHNFMDGHGNYLYADGSKYEGMFFEDHFHGNGTFHESKGAKFVGLWELGLRHGRGILHFSFGGYWEGLWSDDYLQGPVKATCPKGSKMDGCFQDGRLVVNQEEESPQNKEDMDLNSLREKPDCVKGRKSKKLEELRRKRGLTK